VAAKYILAVLAVFFLILASWRVVRDGGRLAPASRTWLLTGVIFGAVSTCLWVAG
jgi:uncharacterized membrane protein